ncbi:MAG: sulfotransferase [Verrucomicrobia bacterium]|nr:sulfotransferase [Verrucomicrobiota bacterium]MCH8511387.1 sulfotransferase [Kiritimatiellia bacterium]
MNQRVFLVGAPRSGSGAMLDLITGQPDFAWVSNKVNAAPEKLALSAKNRQYDWPLLGEYWFERRYYVKRLPHPAEDTDFWEHYLPKFNVDPKSPRIPGPDDVSDEEAKRCLDAVNEIQIQQNKDFFVAQYNEWPRVEMLRKVFPEAKFIQLQRDPRSVAFRLAKSWEKEKSETTLWTEREAWKEIMPESLRARFDDLADTPLNFAGVMVRWWHERYKQEFQGIPDEDWLSLAYADLLSHPQKTVARALKFLGMKTSPRIKRYVKYHQIQDKNQRLRKDLTDDVAAQLERAVKKVPQQDS